MASIQFLGAAGTVTGSRFLLEHDGKWVLIDCGLFQGPKELRLRNWAPSTLDPKSVDAVVLTHAHIDHSGGLPRFVGEGYRGPIFSTAGTRDLCGLLLPDSARLQEEEAAYANKEGFSKHRPALPLYGEAEAHRALSLFETFPYHRPREIVPGVTLTFVPAGHILGSAICVFDLAGTRQRVVFTGDLGRYNAPILKDPVAVESATTLIAESTYGDREHRDVQPMELLAEVVNDAAKRGGVLVIPAFAVGRTQEILYHLDNLERARRIPELPVFVDSPMACDATPIYLAHAGEHDVDMRRLVQGGHTPLRTNKTRFVQSASESKSLNGFQGPGIIISASGMATGGRILHHLKQRAPDERNTILFVGYQSVGTRGRRMLEGEPYVRIHGHDVAVRAKLTQISGFSAHADSTEMLRWMEGFSSPPKQVLLVHGEPSALAALKAKVEQKGWPAYVPRHLERVDLAHAG
ncbi:MAG: MBL fold metallo-hydrolase [Myxococcaceae bacterium]|nr:MBL fold metallo-hydrolase [Myxococcaceae bacterium]